MTTKKMLESLADKVTAIGIFQDDPSLSFSNSFDNMEMACAVSRKWLEDGHVSDYSNAPQAELAQVIFVTQLGAVVNSYSLPEDIPNA